MVIVVSARDTCGELAQTLETKFLLTRRDNRHQYVFVNVRKYISDCYRMLQRTHTLFARCLTDRPDCMKSCCVLICAAWMLCITCSSSCVLLCSAVKLKPKCNRRSCCLLETLVMSEIKVLEVVRVFLLLPDSVLSWSQQASIFTVHRVGRAPLPLLTLCQNRSSYAQVFAAAAAWAAFRLACPLPLLSTLGCRQTHNQ